MNVIGKSWRVMKFPGGNWGAMTSKEIGGLFGYRQNFRKLLRTQLKTDSNVIQEAITSFQEVYKGRTIRSNLRYILKVESWFYFKLQQSAVLVSFRNLWNWLFDITKISSCKGRPEWIFIIWIHSYYCEIIRENEIFSSCN